MPDPKQLPYLLNLLDDDSKFVKQTVFKELKAFGSSLSQELMRLPQKPSGRQREVLQEFLRSDAQDRLVELWPGWLAIADDKEKLEAAFGLLSEFQVGLDRKDDLKSRLDYLCEEYKALYHESNPYKLSRYLFQDKKLTGVHADYYDPANSSLVHVLEKKEGIPISLASIYILVGARLGLDIEGCNMPGHFLARFKSNNRWVFIDCFNGGRVLFKKDMVAWGKSYSQDIEDILEEEVSAETVIRRVLNNLILAYRKNDQWDNAELMASLFQQVDDSLQTKEKISVSDLKKLARGPKLRIGQIVKHKKYDYRGVVVDFDFSCQADDDWYYSNQTQPARNQPWYHVLVDDSSQITYAAEDNLFLDEHTEEVDHPLIPYFFDSFQNGQYVRNSEPWPKV